MKQIDNMYDAVHALKENIAVMEKIQNDISQHTDEELDKDNFIKLAISPLFKNARLADSLMERYRINKVDVSDKSMDALVILSYAHPWLSAYNIQHWIDRHKKVLKEFKSILGYIYIME